MRRHAAWRERGRCPRPYLAVGTSLFVVRYVVDRILTRRPRSRDGPGEERDPQTRSAKQHIRHESRYPQWDSNPNARPVVA